MRGDRHKCGQTAPNDKNWVRCGGLYRTCLAISSQSVSRNLTCYSRNAVDPLRTQTLKISPKQMTRLMRRIRRRCFYFGGRKNAKSKAISILHRRYRMCAGKWGTAGVFKQEALLVCAKLICTECIKEGIKIGADDNPPRPATAFVKKTT